MTGTLAEKGVLSNHLSNIFLRTLNIGIMLCTLVNLYYTGEEYSLRVGLYAFFFLTALVCLPLSFYLLVLTCPLLEQLTLLLHYPNHFIVLYGISGFLSGLTLKARKTQISFQDLCVPLSMNPIISFLLLTSTISSVGWFISMLIEISPFHGLVSFRKLFSHFINGIFVSDFESSPFNTMSVSFNGICLAAFLINIMVHRDRLKLSSKRLFHALLFGSYLVSSYWLLQYFSIIPADFTVELGGPFQNGNHISFYSGMMAILIIMHLRRKTIGFKTYLISLCVVGFPFVLGYGRSAWIGLFSGGLLVSLMFLPYCDFKKLRKYLVPLFFGLVFLAFLAFLVGFNIKFVEGTRSFELFGRILHNVMEGNFFEVLTDGNRKKQTIEALKYLTNNPLLGVGAGNFGRYSLYNMVIHNTYLGLLVEYGTLIIIIAIPVILSFKNIFYMLSSSKRDIFFLSWFVLFIAIAFLGDVFLNYLSLSIILSLILTFFFLKSAQGAHSKWFFRSFIMAVFFCVIQGLLAFEKPYYLFTPVHEQENSEEWGAFSWKVNSVSVEVPKDRCLISQMRHISKENFMLKILDGASTRYAELSPGVWNSVCICSMDRSRELKYNSLDPVVPGFVEGPSNDLRLLGLAVKNNVLKDTPKSHECDSVVSF